MLTILINKYKIAEKIKFSVVLESYVMTVNDPQDIYKEPRTVLLEKTDTGFGFNVRGQVNEGGQLKVGLV